MGFQETGTRRTLSRIMDWGSVQAHFLWVFEEVVGHLTDYILMQLESESSLKSPSTVLA